MKFSLAVVASMAAGAIATGSYASPTPTKTLVTYVTTTVCPATTTSGSSVITTLTTSTLTITTCAGGCGPTTTYAPPPPPPPPVSSLPPASSGIPTTRPTSTRPFPTQSTTVLPGAAPTNAIAGGAIMAGALALLAL